jgi:hypothetical protein
MTMHRLLFAILTICSTEAWRQGTHNPDLAVTASAAQAAQFSTTSPCSTGGQIHMNGSGCYATLAAAFGKCPHQGCTIDMREDFSPKALALGTFDPGSSAVTILLGPYKYTLTQITVRDGLHVIGVTSGATLVTASSPSKAMFILPLSGDYPSIVAQHVLLQGLNLQAAPGSTADGISMVAASSGGLWYSQFNDLVLGSLTTFGGYAIVFDSTAGGSPPATDQFISMRDVIVFRGPNAPPALRVTGAYSGQMTFDNCQFDGPTPHDNGHVNIQIDDGGQKVWIPYSIVMTNVTSQHAGGPNGVAIQLGGVEGFVCQGCHFEDDNGVIREAAGLGSRGNWGVTIKDSYFSNDVARDHGRGFISDTDANSSLAFDDNVFFGTPDAYFIGTSTQYVTTKGTMNGISGGWEPLSFSSFFKIADQGTCTMAGGACPDQTLSHTYVSPPQCFANWNGTGMLTGILKVPSTTRKVTPASSVETDTAQINWACFGN